MKPKLHLYILSLLLFVGIALTADAEKREYLLLDCDNRYYASCQWSYEDRQYLKQAFDDAYRKIYRILGPPSFRGTVTQVRPVDGSRSSSVMMSESLNVYGVRFTSLERQINLSNQASKESRLRGLVLHELTHNHLQPYVLSFYRDEDAVFKLDIWSEAVAETVRILASERTPMEPYWDYDTFQVTPSCNKPQLRFRRSMEEYMPLYEIRRRIATVVLVHWERRHPGFLKSLYQEIFRQKNATPYFQEDTLPIGERITPGFTRYVNNWYCFTPAPVKGYNLLVVGDNDEVFCSLTYTDQDYREHGVPGAQIELVTLSDGRSKSIDLTLNNEGVAHYFMSQTGRYTVVATWANKCSDSFTFDEDAVLR